MAYDPQRERRRPRPAADTPAPIESILDGEPVGDDVEPERDEASLPRGPVVDDPPPDPAVTPHPADPWPDRLLFGVSISTVVGALVLVIVLRWLWLRRRRA